MKSVLSLYNKLWQRIIESTSVDPNVIRSYRNIYVFIFILLFVPHFSWLANIPDALYNPPRLSIAMFFGGFPNIYILVFFQCLLLISLSLIPFKRLSVTFGLVSFFIIIIFSNIRYSIGKIDHEILLPVALLCFTLGNWKQSKENENYILPIPPETLLAIFIGFGMFTAGFQKALYWIDFDLNYSGFLSWFYPGYYNLGRQALLAPVVFKLPSIIIESLDYFAVAFELSALPVIFFGKKIYWKIWIFIACCFHLAILLFLNISFLMHILVYLPFIIPNRNGLVNDRLNIPKWMIVALGTTQLVLYLGFNSSILGILKIDNSYLSIVLLGITMLVALYSIIVDTKTNIRPKTA